MLVAAAAKQSHQQQRTTQPPVSVFPVPCSGALLDPTKPCSARPRHPHQLQVRASSPQPKPQTASSPLSGAEDVENSDAVMRFKGLTSYCYLWANHFWSTKHRSCNGLCRCWRVQLCPSLEMSFSDGQPAPVRRICQMSSCKSRELDDAVVIQFQCWQCQYWGGLDPCLANVSNLVRPLVNLPACAPTPPTISHTHISIFIYTLERIRNYTIVREYLNFIGAAGNSFDAKSFSKYLLISSPPPSRFLLFKICPRLQSDTCVWEQLPALQPSADIALTCYSSSYF